MISIAQILYFDKPGWRFLHWSKSQSLFQAWIKSKFECMSIRFAMLSATMRGARLWCILFFSVEWCDMLVRSQVPKLNWKAAGSSLENHTWSIVLATRPFCLPVARSSLVEMDFIWLSTGAISANPFLRWRKSRSMSCPNRAEFESLMACISAIIKSSVVFFIILQECNPPSRCAAKALYSEKLKGWYTERQKW